MKDLILADNQDITRTGLKTIAAAFDSIASIHVVKDKSALIDTLKVSSESVVIIDYTLFDFSSANELLILQQRFSQSRWIMFSDELSESLVKTLVSGSHAFSIVLKSCQMSEMRTAFIAAIQNDRFVCTRINDMLLNSGSVTDSLSETEPLTLTEKDILKAMAQGKTTKEIAFERNSSFHTIMTHRKNIFRKLNVNNIHEATKYAIRAGLIDVSDYYI